MKPSVRNPLRTLLGDQAGLLPFWRKPARDAPSTSTVGTPAAVVLSITVQPVEPSMIKIARSRWGPENMLFLISALVQRRRLIAWAPLGAQVLSTNVIDGTPLGASLRPGWSSVAIRHCASTLRQVLPEITTSKVDGL